ncbi:bifunctional DNA primase/helicase [Clostridium sp.]
MNEIDFASSYLREYREKGKEIEAKYCPFCNGGKNKDTYTFSINRDKHTYNCLRGKCGEKGAFKELCDGYGVEADYFTEWLVENGGRTKPTQVYIKPQYGVSKVSDKTVNYFEGRGISKETLENADIKSFKKDGQDYAVFQFFQNGILVMNKVRITHNQEIVKGKRELKEWKEKGGKHVLWNMENVCTTVPVVITEGMIDALSVMESGEKNVVSVPSGTNDLTWIDNCYDWITNVKEWILYFDNDEAGDKLTKELVMKLGSYKTRIVKHELNDANDELKVLGRSYIKTVIEKADIIPVIGMTDMAKVKITDPTKMERCVTGIYAIDTYCGGYVFPSLNIWTGRRGSGKSTVVGQSMLKCVDEGFNTFVYTGELSAGFYKLWSCLQAVGNSNIIGITDNKTNITNYKPKDGFVEKVDAWIKGKMFIYDDTNTNKEERLLEMMIEAYKRYNCRVFLIDNLMTVKFKANVNGIWRGQSDFIDTLREFALQNNVVINVVVHPNKGNEVGGSGDITNAAHNLFWVKRSTDEGMEELKSFDGGILIEKNRYYGDTGILSPYHFCKQSKRIYRAQECELTLGGGEWQCPF